MVVPVNLADRSTLGVVAPTALVRLSLAEGRFISRRTSCSRRSRPFPDHTVEVIDRAWAIVMIGVVPSPVPGYELRVRGRVSDALADGFDGPVGDVADGDTILRGRVAEQVALHGILDRIHVARARARRAALATALRLVALREPADGDQAASVTMS